MKLEILEYLNQILSETEITEFTIQKGNTKITIHREPDILKKESTSVAEEASKKEEVPQQIETPKEEEKKYIVRSSTVGVFYHGKTKLGPPLVKIGTSVKKGDLLGMINCVGVLEKVTSPVNGKIVEILVTNRKPVEYDQPLFVIEKE